MLFVSCCVVFLMVIFVEFLFWMMDIVVYLFQKRQDKQMIQKYIENPIEMINDRGEVFWVGYKK